MSIIRRMTAILVVLQKLSQLYRLKAADFIEKNLTAAISGLRKSGVILN
ncbi:hypothetical protein [Aestuariirhabdus sp. LZHN29]